MKRTFSILFALALVLAFSLVATAPVAAATPIYVDAARPDDSGDGTSPATAKKTIQAGIGVVDVGGTATVAAGTYSENVVISKQLTLQAAASGAIVDAGGIATSDPGVIGIKIAANGATVDGMEVINARGHWSAGIAVSGSIRRVSIINCTVHNANSGISLYETGDGATNLINQNTVYDIHNDYSTAGCGIIAWGDSTPCNDTTITDNEVYSTQRWSIALGSDAVAPCVDNVISGNNIHDNNNTEAIGVGLINAINNSITDNDISGCQIGIGLNKGSSNNDISGNTILDNEMGVAFYAASGLSSDSNTLEDNTISSNTWQGVYIDDCDDNELLGNTITDNWVGINCDHGSDGNIVEGNTISSNNPINIYLTGASTDTTITCNTISSAGWGGIQFIGGSTGVVHKNNIVGNPIGLWNDGPALVDAENNWWGDDSGPNHWITNPTGTGNPVTDNVDFDPWIKKAVVTDTVTGTASFATSNGNIVGLMAVAPPPTPPAGVTFPHGMFSFQICCLSDGETVTLTITLPADVPEGTVWWKYEDGHWYSLPNLSDDGDAIMVISLTDGGSGDGDSVPGQITDDGGPGNPGAVGWDTYPISKVRVLLPWITLIAAIMAGASLLVLRRRRTQT